MILSKAPEAELPIPVIIVPAMEGKSLTTNCTHLPLSVIAPTTFCTPVFTKSIPLSCIFSKIFVGLDTKSAKSRAAQDCLSLQSLLPLPVAAAALSSAAAVSLSFFSGSDIKILYYI